TAVRRAEGLPSEPNRKARPRGEVTEPTDGVVGRAELKEERRKVWCDEATSGRWTPKVHLVEVRPPKEKLIPALVSDGDCAEHMRYPSVTRVRVMVSVQRTRPPG